eukprot:1498651-Prorocentrum_lima.AAC.1
MDTTMILQNWSSIPVELAPDLWVNDPLLVASLLEGPAWPHSKGSWLIFETRHGLPEIQDSF